MVILFIKQCWGKYPRPVRKRWFPPSYLFFLRLFTKNLWDLCSQGQAMCYATLTAQIPQIFCNQAKKEEVCRWKPAFCYFHRIVQCYVNQISLNYLPRNVLRGIESSSCLILPQKCAFWGIFAAELL